MKRSSIGAALAAAVLAVATVATGSDPLGKPVEYDHDGTKLEGYLAVDSSSPGKRPGVLIVHEWWGHDDYVRARADQLAKLGYVAFALDMYGKGVKATHPKEAGEWAGKIKKDRNVMRARAQAGLDVLKKHELCDPSKTAAIGYCFGGTTVLELARAGADVTGVVSFHGALDTPLRAESGKVKAKVLVLNGADDTFIPAKDIADFEEEMRKAGADWQLVQYGGAVHSFTNPSADKHGIKGIAYNAAVDARSWQAMKSFFDEMFAKK